MKERLEKYIESIEQLGADARYDCGYDNYDKIRTDLESIITWCNMAIVVLNRLKRGVK